MPKADRRRLIVQATAFVPGLAAALVTAGLLRPATAAGEAASSFGLSDLMRLMTQRRSGEARFTEERFVSGLDQTLNSSGVLRFSAPDSFERHTELPRPESMVVRGSQVTLERGGRRRQLSLDAVPELAALVAAIRGTLTGDVDALRAHFRAEAVGSAALWTLSLTPLDRGVAASVRQLRIAGQQANVRSVEIDLADGDRSLMQIALPQAPARSRPAGTP